MGVAPGTLLEVGKGFAHHFQMNWGNMTRENIPKFFAPCDSLGARWDRCALRGLREISSDYVRGSVRGQEKVSYTFSIWSSFPKMADF